MALSKIGQYTGTNSAGSAAVACQEGDVFYAFAFRDGSTTAPTLPSSAGAAGGWVMLPNGTAGASTVSFRAAKLTVPPSSDEFLGTDGSSSSEMAATEEGSDVAAIEL